MTTRILWLRPVTTSEYNDTVLDFLTTGAMQDTELTVRTLDRGPRHLEYHYYSALVLSDVLLEVKRAERDGYDGVVIACFYDTALREAREIAERIVVAAPGESAVHIAAALGRKFSIIVGDKKWIPKMCDNVIRYGFQSHLASFKSIDVGVLELQKDRAKTEERLLAAATDAREHDSADVIILGCTMGFGFYSTLQRQLEMPVIDPVLASLKHMEFLLELKKRFNWTASNAVDYRTPPLNEIKGWDLEGQYGLGEIW